MIQILIKINTSCGKTNTFHYMWNWPKLFIPGKLFPGANHPLPWFLFIIILRTISLSLPWLLPADVTDLQCNQKVFRFHFLQTLCSSLMLKNKMVIGDSTWVTIHFNISTFISLWLQIQFKDYLGSFIKIIWYSENDSVMF